MSDSANQTRKVSTPSAPVSAKNSYFDGNFWQYLGWNLLANLLTTVTLGIAYPVAMCMRLRWQTNHTVINGRRLKFTGTGGALFGKYILWWLLTVVTFGSYGIQLSLRLKQWTIEHTVYADDTTNAPSRYTARLLPYLGMRLLAVFLTVISFGIAYPWVARMLLCWDDAHTYISGTRLGFVGTGGGLLGRLLLWGLLSVVTLSVFSWFIPIKYLKWVYMHTGATPVAKVPKSPKERAWIILVVIAVVLALILLLGFGAAMLLPRLNLPGYDIDFMPGEVIPQPSTPVIGDPSLEATDADPQQLKGYYISTEELKDPSAVGMQIQALDENAAIMVELSDPYGRYNYSASFTTHHNDNVDTAQVDQLIQELTESDHYTIAKIHALQNYYYGLENVGQGLFAASGNYLWADESSCYWLDPSNQQVIDYLVLIAGELRSAGFDEVVFDQFQFPDGTGYAFTGDKDEALYAAACTLVDYCATDSFAVSFVGNSDFRLPESRSRLYLKNVPASEVAAVTENIAVQDKATQVVFLTGQVDARFEAFGVMYPIADAPSVERGYTEGSLCYDMELPIVTAAGETAEVIVPTRTGNVTILNFWGTWCSPCIAELPYFDQIAAEYPDDVTVIAIHSAMSRETAPEFIGSYYPNSQIVFSWDSEDGSINGEYYTMLGGPGAYPYTLVLDENGVIVKIFPGSITYEDVKAVVDAALAD